MRIDEIREEYLKEKGSKLRAILAAKEMLKENEPIEKIVKYTMLSKEEILHILSLNEDVENKVETLISMAKDNGGDDNIAIALWEANQ